jgi:hypothetical protein
MSRSKRHATARHTLFALFATIVVSGCDADPAMPSNDDLVGIWVNDDAGQIRAFDFMATAPEGSSPALTAKPFVYHLYFHTRGTTPTIVQRGHFDVRFGRLVTEVVEAPLDPTQVGRMFGNDVRAFSPSRLVLQSDSAPSGERVYLPATTVP